MKTANSTEKSVTIPRHLPRRLAICYYGWDWFTSALPDEAYGNLDRAMRETKERGFNCIRAEMGLGLLYDWNGKRRGDVKFAARLPGANSNMHCVDGKGGGVHHVWERVMLLFNLAEKYDLYIIGTSWLYQDFITDIADDSLREELICVPYNRRLMMLARQWDWLLHDIEKRDLSHRLAFAELLNEMGHTRCSAAEDHEGTPTFEEWLNGGPRPAAPERLRQFARDALALLQERHPEILITVDIGTAQEFPSILPDNAPLADHHVYATPGVTHQMMKAARIREAPGPSPILEGNTFLQSLLKEDSVSWEEANRRSTQIRKYWRPILWFFQNIDEEKYDAWCTAHYDECRESTKRSMEDAFRTAADFAHQRGLPLVVDEGYLFPPPLNSRFVMTPDGRWGEETAVNAAIETGHWGIVPTCHFRPNTPIPWYDDSQCEWIRGLNRRILDS